VRGRPLQLLQGHSRSGESRPQAKLLIAGARVDASSRKFGVVAVWRKYDKASCDRQNFNHAVSLADVRQSASAPR